MNIVQHATYNKQDVEIQSREMLFRGFIQVEKVSLRHCLFHQTAFIPTIQRELIHRPEAAGVLLYDDVQRKFALIEQFRIGTLDDSASPWQLEIIAGVLDGDEPALTELQEAAQQGGHLDPGELAGPGGGVLQQHRQVVAQARDVGERV